MTNGEVTKEQIESIQGELLALREVTATILRHIIVSSDDLRVDFAGLLEHLASTVPTNYVSGIRQGYSLSLKEMARKVREG